jgi:hypothetical protein
MTSRPPSRSRRQEGGSKALAIWQGTVRLLTGAILSTTLLGGCAALTNPVADAVPVRSLPPEVLGESRSAAKPIPLPLLGQKRPTVYRVAAGDVLGIWIEGVLGERTQLPPVHISPSLQTGLRRQPPALGLPVTVREDGTISLPLIPPLQVQGMTLREIEQAIRKAYTEPKNILPVENARIDVTLIQPRQYHVIVLRQESPGFTQGPLGNPLPAGKRGTGFAIDLPAYENDVLHALALTGGLPGLDTCNEIIVQRECFQNPEDAEVVRQQAEAQLRAGAPPLDLAPSNCVRIPLRWCPDKKLPFKPADVILHNGDIVYLPARDTEVFYTGGLLPSAEHILPRDRDLDVVQAIAFVRGPLINGAFGTNNLAGNLINNGIGFDSPSLLVVVRRLPGCGQIPIRVDLNHALRDPRERILVQPGDLLILQEMPNAALARYIGTTLLNFTGTWQPFHSTWFSSALDIGFPQQFPGRIGIGNFRTIPQ